MYRDIRNEESGELMREANRLYRASNPLSTRSMEHYGHVKSELSARLWDEDSYLCGGCEGACKESHLNVDQVADYSDKLVLS